MEFAKEARNLSSPEYLQPVGMNIQPGLFYVLAPLPYARLGGRRGQGLMKPGEKNANKSRAARPRGVRGVRAAAADKNIRPAQIRGSETDAVNLTARAARQTRARRAGNHSRTCFYKSTTSASMSPPGLSLSLFAREYRLLLVFLAWIILHDAQDDGKMGLPVVDLRSGSFQQVSGGCE